MTGRSDNRRVLLHSPRATGVGYPAVSPHLEFEDLVTDFDDTEMVSAPLRGSRTTLARAHNRLNKLVRGANNLNLGYEGVTPEAATYDLFFTMLLDPDDALALNAVDRWRERCGTAVAWVVEAWEFELDSWKGQWDVLSRFDHIVVTMDPCRGPIEERTGVPTTYLQTATDTLLFAPTRETPRPIDVLSIGRRSEITHQHLKDMLSAGEIFYHFDTIRAPQVRDHAEHRFMYAALAQRSKLFIANRSKIGADDETGGQHEYGGRFFEAGAAGATAIGAFADTDHFRADFDWPDANIEIAFDADPRPEVEGFLADEDRQRRAAARSIDECLGRHDWVHRWETILGLVGMEPSAGMVARREAIEERRAVLAAA